MTGEKVALRAVEPSDVENIHAWENNISVWKVSNTLTPYSRYIIEQYVLNADQDIFSAKQLRLMIDCICETKQQPIGTIDLFEFDPQHRRAGVGIMIAPEFRRQGYASEALDLLKAYAFDTLQLHQLFCHVAEDNFDSLRLFEEHGFIKTGTRQQWLLIKGNWVNEHILQCINEA